MPYAWFLCPYKRQISDRPSRYCAMNDFTAQIYGEGGAWSETEILGNMALVKVRASEALLAIINAADGFLRIPAHFRLTDTLGDLTSGQRSAIVNKLQAMGYTLAEIRAVMPSGGWTDVTLGQVLHFAAKRRLRPRYEQATDTIICDGPVQPVRPVESVDGEVQ